MTGRSQHKDRITDEAAVWFVRAQGPGFTSEDRKELVEWLAGSAEHVREYLELASLTHDIKTLAETPSVDALINVARAAANEQNIVAFSSKEPIASGIATADTRTGVRQGDKSRHRFGRWAAAASVLITIATGFWVYTASLPIVYSTGVGEQVSFPLDDGSVITLNARSSLELAYTENERNVRLIAGEALFDVAKDPDRPFQVKTDRAVIRAVGTAFNVRHRGDDTTVTVVEGVVDVRSLNSASAILSSHGPGGTAQLPVPGSPGTPNNAAGTVRLTVGQQASVPSKSGSVAVIEANVEKATSWRERRLVFESWALSAVVAEFNLYNDQRIEISDERLAARPISGAFSADDRESFALFLNEAGLATSEVRSDGTIVLRSGDEIQ